MADFFTRLAERALGMALIIEPMLASMFEPEFTSVEEAPLESAFDEVELDVQTSALQDATPSPRDPPQVAARPQSSDPANGSTKEPGISPASTLLSPFTARARERTIEQAAASRAYSPRSEAPLHMAQADRQVGAQADRQVGDTPSTSQPGAHAARSGSRPAPGVYDDIYNHSEGLQRQPDLPTLSKLAPGRHTEPPARSPLPSSAVARQTVGTPTMPPEKTRLNMQRGGGSHPGRNSDSLPQFARAVSRKNVAREEALPVPGNEPQSAKPAIQVTIGRIEVRATSMPATEPEKKAPAAASPVMSLDDYLQSRMKGGH